MTSSARPLPDLGPSSILTRVVRVGALAKLFQERSVAPFGLHFIDFSLLRVLQLVGDPHAMTPSDLAHQLQRSMAGVTQIVDRLAIKGLVDRNLDPGDRRRILVTLTPEGFDALESARLTYAEDRDRLLGSVAASDLEAADRVLRQVFDLLGTDNQLAEK